VLQTAWHAALKSPRSRGCPAQALWPAWQTRWPRWRAGIACDLGHVSRSLSCCCVVVARVVAPTGRAACAARHTFHVFCCGSGGRTPSERTSACGPSSPITSSLKRASCLQVPGLVPTRPAELSEDKTHSEQAYPAITDIRADIALRRFGSKSAIRPPARDVRIASRKRASGPRRRRSFKVPTWIARQRAAAPKVVDFSGASSIQF